MKLFVTGGAGYIGSVVCEKLIERGHEVVVYDNLSTGHRGAVHPECRFIQGELRDDAALSQAMRPGTDAVLHFAARSLVAASMQDPLGYYDHNLGAAVSLLRVMLERGVQRLVFSSTAAVYGETDLDPIPEEAPLQPSHAYGGSKRAIEMLCENVMQAHDLRAIFLRYFNAAGASQKYGESHAPETHLVPNLLRSAIQNEAVAIFGNDYPTPDGTCVRDYVHVLDLAEAHVRALAALDSGVQGGINLGSGGGHSVLEVLEAARRVTGRDIPARVEARRPGDPPRLVAGVQLASRQLGWLPRRSGIEEMLESAWQWLQAHPKGYVSGGS